jgi:hypothetical protein
MSTNSGHFFEKKLGGNLELKPGAFINPCLKPRTGLKVSTAFQLTHVDNPQVHSKGRQ